VGSGDPENCEAQAARRYWKPLMGPAFKRDVKAEGVNSLLNYGYAVLRAATARAVAASGLHPALSLHHHNQANPFGLVDDLMEPFRPCVDQVVRKLKDEGLEEVIPDTKRQLAAVLDMDLKTERGTTPLSNTLFHMAQSLVTSYETRKDCLILPEATKGWPGNEDS
ncbi:MAG: type II CRISPR-associated endonuclease Cas1, partial [Nitrospinaceae bacterium]|nr:type II CRISPR-associated endonuclease Cas1 [Nitrospinaceae bacterium]NIR54152.1 type II CRISPR-associated endonuclease Cas1 [Nitrospinaceae bacterium]NIS84566.1 type II CRISPR-associated endonuclease Cas1 [Nitrospinaceae bacterium]NIT81358.1 type II CRISPR-associated endonuclease Cas1 [Nitrospinaceae bacterium]NIU43645.1 type II CRISPR-associated endonuclease Cas1 [Nitrospinaceae bacterium]